MGVDRHERLVFAISPVGPSTSELAPEAIERLVRRLLTRGKGSFISAILKDCTVRVEVLRLGQLWRWDVKKGRETIDTGIATVTAVGEIELTSEEVEQ